MQFNFKTLHDMAFWFTDYFEEMSLLASIADLSQYFHFQEQFPNHILIN